MFPSSTGVASSTAIRRLTRDFEKISVEPILGIEALPTEENILEWHYCIKGSPGTDYEGGYYHGKLLFQPDFPWKPPAICMTTPNGRFRTNMRLCLSISDYHPESWNPGWTVSAILVGLHSFMNDEQFAAGVQNDTSAVRRELASLSKAYNLRNPEFTRMFPKLAAEFRAEPSVAAAVSLASEAGTPSSSAPAPPIAAAPFPPANLLQAFGLPENWLAPPNGPPTPNDFYNRFIANMALGADINFADRAAYNRALQPPAPVPQAYAPPPMMAQTPPPMVPQAQAPPMMPQAQGPPPMMPQAAPPMMPQAQAPPPMMPQAAPPMMPQAQAPRYNPPYQHQLPIHPLQEQLQQQPNFMAPQMRMPAMMPPPMMMNHNNMPQPQQMPPPPQHYPYAGLPHPPGPNRYPANPVNAQIYNEFQQIMVESQQRQNNRKRQNNWEIEAEAIRRQPPQPQNYPPQPPPPQHQPMIPMPTQMRAINAGAPWDRPNIQAVIGPDGNLQEGVIDLTNHHGRF